MVGRLLEISYWWQGRHLVMLLLAFVPLHCIGLRQITLLALLVVGGMNLFCPIFYGFVMLKSVFFMSMSLIIRWCLMFCRTSLAFRLMPQSNAVLDCSPIAAVGHVIPQSYVPVSVSQFMDDLSAEEDALCPNPENVCVRYLYWGLLFFGCFLRRQCPKETNWNCLNNFFWTILSVQWPIPVALVEMDKGKLM